MTDLTVRGAGIFGLSIAWEALKRGAAVTVIDPHGPGAGSSGGVVGALQPHTPDPWNDKKQFQFESLLLARNFWTEVEAASGIPSGYARVGRVQPLASEREIDLAKQRTAPARQNWQGQATWQVVDADLAGDWRPPSPTGLYVSDTLSAILNPRAAVESLASAIRAKGGAILSDGDAAGNIVWATGWQGLLDLNAALERPVGNGVKGQAALLGYNAAGQSQIFASGLHFVPHLDGTLAIGSTSEREFDTPDATDHQLDDLLERATAILPVLHGVPVLKRWAGVRPRSQSRAPLLGPWPDRPGHYIANGGFKIGFGMAPKVAEVMVDLMLEGQDRIPPEFRTDAIMASDPKA